MTLQTHQKHEFTFDDVENKIVDTILGFQKAQTVMITEETIRVKIKHLSTN